MSPTGGTVRLKVLVQPRLSGRTSVGGIRDKAREPNSVAVSNPTEISMRRLLSCFVVLLLLSSSSLKSPSEASPIDGQSRLGWKANQMSSQWAKSAISQLTVKSGNRSIFNIYYIVVVLVILNNAFDRRLIAHKLRPTYAIPRAFSRDPIYAAIHTSTRLPHTTKITTIKAVQVVRDGHMSSFVLKGPSARE